MRAIITDFMTTRLCDTKLLRTIYDATATAVEKNDITTLKAFVKNGAQNIHNIRKCFAMKGKKEYAGYWTRGKVILAKKQFGEDDKYFDQSHFDGIRFL